MDIRWIGDQSQDDPIEATMGYLNISILGNCATTVADTWSKSYSDAVPVSAYPLALWFAANWWRLRWEPIPEHTPAVDWQMAHHTATVGHGFIWPRLRFISDMQTIIITCERTTESKTEPFWYLNSFQASITPDIFEQGIKNFIELVRARLDSLKLQDTQLHSLWNEVLEEQNDRSSSSYRKHEAMLGFDPDAGSEMIVNSLEQRISEGGEEALSEIAAACAGEDAASHFDAFLKQLDTPGVPVSAPPLFPPSSPNTEPWQYGWELARQARREWNMPSGVISNPQLAELFSTRPAMLFTPPNETPHSPLGLAVKNGNPANLELRFRRPFPLSRRFETARFLCDYLLHPRNGHWLPVTDAKTARQKIQRAFAAEFLCPLEELLSFLDGDYSQPALDEAGNHFSVSPLAVKSLLANNDVIPRFDAVYDL